MLGRHMTCTGRAWARRHRRQSIWAWLIRVRKQRPYLPLTCLKRLTIFCRNLGTLSHGRSFAKARCIKKQVSRSPKKSIVITKTKSKHSQKYRTWELFEPAWQIFSNPRRLSEHRICRGFFHWILKIEIRLTHHTVRREKRGLWGSWRGQILPASDSRLERFSWPPVRECSPTANPPQFSHTWAQRLCPR